MHKRARRLLKRRERGLQYADKRDPGELGVDSVVEYKELKGALETQHRSLCYFELRVAGEDPTAVRRVAGTFSQLRSENELARREMRLRRRLYARRIERALPNPLPGLARGILSTSELATLWQLPRARSKLARIPRMPLRRAVAPPEVCRDPARRLLVDEQGPVGIHPDDRKFGQALMGGQGSGKTSAMAPGVAIDARDDERAVVVVDAKEELARLALGLIPEHRTVHYIDLGRPEIGFNPLTIDASPGTRASVFIGALVEANPPGAIQARSDDLLRQAVSVVCAVERAPTVWDVYRMLSPGDGSYRESALTRLDEIAGMDFARYYWRREFPELLRDRSRTLDVLDPPLNKLRRLLSTPQVDVVLRHPYSLDLEGAIARGEVIVVNGAKAVAGEDNTRLLFQLLLRLVQRAIQAQQSLPENERRRVSLYVDEAHNVLTASVATLLAEGRSAGLEACFAWQYTAQIRDELVRSGVRSLLQSISIFRMRELEDARALAGLAMDIYSDRISIDQQEQERLRFSADDIIHLPVHTAINLWVARGTPRSAFVAGTLPMQELYDPALAEHHLAAQRDRGGHYPAHLPAPLGDKRSADTRGQDGTPQRPGSERGEPELRPAATPRRRRRSPEPSSSCSRTCSDAARQLHRGAPLRRRDHPAPTQRRPATMRAAPARPRHRPRRLALPLPHHQPGARTVVVREVHPGGAPAARQALPRRLPRALPPLQPTRLLRMDLLPQRRQDTACCATSAPSTPVVASNPATCSTTGAPSTTSSSTPGCSPTADCSAAALLEWHGEHQLTPPRTARQAQLRLSDD